MRVTVTVAGRHGNSSQDVVIDAAPGTTMHELATVLARRQQSPASILGGYSASPPMLFVAGVPLPPELELGGSPIVDGALVSLDDPSIGISPEPAGLVELRVVCGPGAGTVLRLGPGDITVGSSPTASLCIADPAMAPVALRISVQISGEVSIIRDEATKIGDSPTADPSPRTRRRRTRTADAPATDAPVPRRSWINADDAQRPIATAVPVLAGTPLTDAASPWHIGQELHIGSALLEIHHPTEPDYDLLTPSHEGGWLDYNRPPRLRPPVRKTAFRLPAAPAPTIRGGLPILGSLAPAALGVALAIMMRQPQYLVMAAMTPLMLLANSVSTRRSGRRTYRQQLRDHRAHVQVIDDETARALVAERAARRQASPDPAQVLMIATGPRARLWERRREDADHLLLRVGTADLPSEVTVDDPERMEHKRKATRIARAVPVTVDLKQAGVLGVADPGPLRHELAKWLIGQLAVLQSPRDVQCYLLTDSGAEALWRWTVWLPHLRPSPGNGPGASPRARAGADPTQEATAFIGTDAQSLARRVAELNQIIIERGKAMVESNGRAAFEAADIVVVLDGARRLRALPGIVTLLKDGPAMGVYCICIEANERLLPEECTTVVLADPDGLVVRRQLAQDITHVRADLVTPNWYQRVGRALAPIRDVGDRDSEGTIPSSSRLLDVLGMPTPTDEQIAARWAIRPASTSAIIGESIDGAFAIDLRTDGPHGLIAGTTGSGKSELLQTIVASLAVANRPDAMTFVLVDHKGGAAFKDCVKLPHTVGMVTDLDTHLVERALTSLGAELTRREHILATVGEKNIEDYSARQVKDPRLAPLPRLLIVIDEFASMARELPEFVGGLVNIAQRGRSLGIHLILATQRPTGVVSPEIRANTNLRIALRVTDPAESADVIDAPDAARISKETPGRAYVRLGHSSLVPFQSSRVGARVPGASAPVTQEAFVGAVTWNSMGLPAPQPPTLAAEAEQEVTDLAVLVEAIRGASARARIPAQHRPWLAALPARLPIDEVLAASDEPAKEATREDIAPIPYGFEDVPTLQQRRVAALELARLGHLHIIGSPRSGRSQALRTIAGMIAQHTTSADVHLFGIDCGNGALLPITALPHCGAVVARAQSERAQRLLQRLRAEILRRQELLGLGGFADITEQRAAAEPHDRLAHLVVLLDRWEGFTTSLGELDNGALTEIVMTILREGASAGVHMVMSGDRSLLSGRMATLTEDKLMLRMADRGDYTLAGLNPRKLPDDPPPGRAFRAESGLETQFAILGSDPAGPAQAAQLARIADAARQRDSAIPRSQRAFRVDVLPARLPFDEAWGMREHEQTTPLWAMIGVGGDELLALGADLHAGPATFVIGGPAKSGRSTLLEAMTHSILRSGGEVVIATPRPSPLRALRQTPGVRAVLTETALTVELLAPLMEEGPVALIMDDAELLKEVPAREWLRDTIRTAREHQRAVVIAGNADEICAGFSGWQLEFKKNRNGALLCPQGVMDGDLLGIRVPRSSLGQPVQAGRALIHLGDGRLQTVQVPVTSET